MAMRAYVLNLDGKLAECSSLIWHEVVSSKPLRDANAVWMSLFGGSQHESGIG